MSDSEKMVVEAEFRSFVKLLAGLAETPFEAARDSNPGVSQEQFEQAKRLGRMAMAATLTKIVLEECGVE